MIKSFLITFSVIMLVSVGLLFFARVNLKEKADRSVIKSTKRLANEEDILNILQLIELKNKRLLNKIVINPVIGDIFVDKIDINQKGTHGAKTLGEIYDYGGMRLLLKSINENISEKYNRYIVIKGEEKLGDLLDVVGSVNIKDQLYEKIREYTGEESQIINANRFIELIDHIDEETIAQIIRFYFKQKILLFDMQRGEDIFKGLINLVESDISYKDFKNLTEINLKTMCN